MFKKIINYAIFALCTLALIVGGYFYWLHEKKYPTTDDAYIHAHVIDVASQVNGKVLQVWVHNQEHVQKNQVLFTIDPTPFQIAAEKAKADLQNTIQQTQAEQNSVRAAKAELIQSQAQLVNTQKNYDRIMALVKEGFYAKSGADDVTRELTVAKQSVVAANAQLQKAEATLGKTGDKNASIQSAQAAVAQSALNLQYTTIRAAMSGQLAEFHLQPGQTVTAYAAQFSLVADNSWWAVANMKETNMNRILVGQKAVIYVDMYPSHGFQGIVKSISPGSGTSFALLPSENATGNWVKVTQRIPVRVNILNPDSHFPLRIGASCTVTIDTHEKK